MLRKILYLFFLCSSLPLVAAFTCVDGQWSNEKYAPTMSASDHLNTGYALLKEGNYEEALRNFQIVTIHFLNTPQYDEALFYSSIAYYFLGDYEVANNKLSAYLSSNNALHHYEDAFTFKYHVANQFAKGAKKHLFGYEKLPRWLPASNDAITLYDEIIASMPTEDLAAKALYSKAELMRTKGQYRESIETLQTLTRRFPRHELALQSYFQISDIYLEEANSEPQNPDLISLAKINQERFQKSFPGDERKDLLEANIHQMEKLFSASLYEMARYYDRKGKSKASQLYYQEAATHFSKSGETNRNPHHTLAEKP